MLGPHETFMKVWKVSRSSRKLLFPIYVPFLFPFKKFNSLVLLLVKETASEASEATEVNIKNSLPKTN